MISNGPFAYVFIIACIAGLRLVAPLSIVYLAFCAWFRQQTSLWLTAYATVEVGFLLVCQARKARLQRPPKSFPPPLNREQRKALFAKCTADVNEETLANWFVPPSAARKRCLKRHDIIEWLLWAMFSARVEDIQGDWEHEIEEYIELLEEIVGRRFEHGRSDELRSMKLSFDPVQVVHRPFIWYISVTVVDTISSARLLLWGFKHYASPSWLQTFPPRPLLMPFSRRAVVSSESQMAYWYRPHRSTTKTPILFLHGIGIGLYPYIPLFNDIISDDPDVGIILVELLPISFHITDGPVPSRQVVLDALDNILESLGIDRVVLMSHSFGTFLSAYIMHAACPRKHINGSDHETHHGRHFHPIVHRISHTILIDPISILLHLPSVAYNFLYRQPSRPAEWQLWYLASRDPDVARTLSKAFFWEQGALWGEDIAYFMGCPCHHPNATSTKENGVPVGEDVARVEEQPLCCRDIRRNVTVVLSEQDQIVPAEAVRRYLTGEEKPSLRWVRKGPRWPWCRSRMPLASTSGGPPVLNGKVLPNGPSLMMNGGLQDHAAVGTEGSSTTLEVLFFPGLDHGQVFDTKARRNHILNSVHRYVSNLGLSRALER